MSNIIFDFDGTLADTFGLIVDVTYELTGVSRLPAKELTELRSLPVLTAIRRLSGAPWHIPKLIVLTRRRMNPRMAKVPIFPGISELLAELSSSGHRLFILSSNTAANVDAFLQAHSLTEYFEAVYSVPYGNVWFKTRALRKILRRLRLDKTASYYVGNEVLDIEAAKAAGMRSVAVTWSGQNETELAAAKPDFIVHTPAELIDAFVSLTG